MFTNLGLSVKIVAPIIGILFCIDAIADQAAINTLNKLTIFPLLYSSFPFSYVSLSSLQGLGSVF